VDRPQSLPRLEQQDVAEDEPHAVSSAGRQRPQPQQQQPEGQSAKQQAREWFKNFLVEAESEVQAAEAAKSSDVAQSAASPATAQSLIEEMEQDRQVWEERTRKLLKSRGGCDEADPENLLPTASAANAGSSHQNAAEEAFIMQAAEVAICEATAPEDASPEADSQIVAALREAGLEPGAGAADALSAAATESRLAAAHDERVPLSPVSESVAGDHELAGEGLCPATSDDKDFDSNSRLSTAATMSMAQQDGVAPWSTPARRWAADRLRRKREKGLRSRPCTPSSAPEEAAAEGDEEV